MKKNNQLTISAIVVAGALIAAAVITTRPSTEQFVAVSNTPQTREFSIVMENNRYNPSEITVGLGDKVIINFTNRDNVAHAVGIADFNATVPGGHVFPGQPARMEFVASKKMSADAAVCGGPTPTDKTDDHGEELIVNVV